MAKGWRLVLAVLGGLATSAAFDPFSFWPGVILGPALLLFSIQAASARYALLLGWVFGFAHFLTGVWWVLISTHVFGGAPLALAIVLLVLLSAYLGLFPALSAWLYVRLRGSAGLAVWLWPAVWLLGEFARSLVLNGFPWFSLGYAATDVPGLLHLAPVLGVHGASLVLAASAAALVAASRRRWIAVLWVLLLWVGVQRLPEPADWTEVAGEGLDVALLQGNIRQNQKWHPINRIPTMELYADMTAKAWPADLVIWPEVAIPAPLDMVEDYFEEQRLAAEAAGGTLFFTILTYQDGKPYNTVYALGEGQGRYVKSHLVPFGEYIPTPDWMRPFFDVLNLPLPDIRTGLPGDRVLTVGAHQVSMSICFEDVFPLEVRETARHSAFLVNVTNDAWFDGSAATLQHLQIARLRAAESGRSLLRVANTGVSAIIDANGDVLDRLDSGVRGSLRGQVMPRQGETPYQRWGHGPLWVYVALTLLAALILRRGLLR